MAPGNGRSRPRPRFGGTFFGTNAAGFCRAAYLASRIARSWSAFGLGFSATDPPHANTANT